MTLLSHKSIPECFARISDPRLDRKKLHPLINVLTISLCAMLCGAESFDEMEAFGLERRQWLGQFLDLSQGIPSHDTFNRVFSLIDPKAFNQSFMEWTQSIRQAIGREIVALDGKQLRRSGGANVSATHIVSAWAHENGLCLGQQKVDDKSNEITAIPELLRALELSGCIVTIDAMGCQKTIAREICNADADYVLALKGNHELLHHEVRTFLEDALARNFQNLPHDYFETIEKDHGRIETRKYWITTHIGWMAEAKLWENLRAVGLVEDTRQSNGTVSTERRFYLTSLPCDAKEFARAVRGHWSVENNLHWCLDVCFHEDQARARAGFAAQNLSTLRHLCLNILKQDSSKKLSLKRKRFKAALNPDFLASLLRF